MINYSVLTIPCTTDAGVQRNIKMSSTSLEKNDQGSNNVLVSDPVNTNYALRSKGRAKCAAGVANFGLSGVRSIVGK